MRYSDRATTYNVGVADSIHEGPCITLSIPGVMVDRLSLSTVRAIVRAAEELGITGEEPTAPCPFCGGADVAVVVVDRGEWGVECRTCWAEGPGARSEPAAIAAWNSRKGELVVTSMSSSEREEMVKPQRASGKLCPSCRGKGQTSYRTGDEYSGAAGWTEYETCARCNGTGVVEVAR